MSYYCYAISSLMDDAIYWGYAKDLPRRYRRHLNEARNTTTSTPKLNWLRKILRESPDSLFRQTISGPFERESEACMEERRLIMKSRIMGWKDKNATWGGEFGSLSPETKEKLRQTMARPEVQKKRSESMKKFHARPEVKEMFRQLRAERKMGNHLKPVRCLDTGELFDSAVDAERNYCLCKGRVSEICRGLRTHTQGLHFRWAS